MGGAETMFVFFIKIESNKCFSKTYSEIEIMWPINSSKDVLSRDSKELFVQRFVKVFCKQPLLIFSMVHSYMDLKVYSLDCMTASGFRVQITGLVVLFKLPSLALKHVPTSIQKPKTNIFDKSIKFLHWLFLVVLDRFRSFSLVPHCSITKLFMFPKLSRFENLTEMGVLE